MRWTLWWCVMLFGLLCRCGDSRSPADEPSPSSTAKSAPEQDPASETAARPAPAPLEPVGPDSPNVVVVLIDTTRPDHLPPYGYDREVAPFLHRLTQRSVVFEQAHSTSSWTGPSTASLFTGMYPTRHGLTQGFFAQRQDVDTVQGGADAAMDLTPIRSDVRTLPEWMRDLGYSTFGFSANINVGPELGFDRGFGRFERRRKMFAPDLFREVQTWWRDVPEDSPYFLYLHFNDPHKPYNGRAPLYRQREDPLEDTIARYDSEIHLVDGVLRRMYDQFDWNRNTLLWILSDHGEEFRERGEIGHGFSLYNELLRVAMVVRGPGLEPRRIEMNVSLIDVAPTILDLLDRPCPEAFDGRSLQPLLFGTEAEPPLQERVLFGHRQDREGQRDKWAAVRGQWKLLHDTRTQEWLLFDLAEDPRELEDLAEQRPDVARELRTALEQLIETTRRSPGEDGASVQVPLDPATLEHLRSLGYLDDH